MKRIKLDIVDSTNTYSKGLDASLYEGGESVVVTAEEQTAGRGRLGRSFYSPAGAGVYMTYSFQPAFPAEDLMLVTGITGSIVHRALTEVTGADLAIKWVNDIYTVKDGCYYRKVVGMLAEACGDPCNRIVIGIGVDVYAHELPDDLADKVGAIADHPTDAFTREEIVQAIAEGLDEAFLRDRLDPAKYVEYYRENCLLTGRMVNVVKHGSEPYPAVVKGISDTFGLIVLPQGSGEMVELTSGEISLELI